MAEPPSKPSGKWTVYRIDDRGNTFVVRGGLERAEAERLAAEFEAHGHKQMYWVEADPPSTAASELRER